ncbi:MAG TPA: sugar ABC transporter permease [Acetobacteraceae bacterium]|jgi:multiple sugar transport system permease protein|nr:sugar ABC transporter permease [Acetobacteraceae bacterium]
MSGADATAVAATRMFARGVRLRGVGTTAQAYLFLLPLLAVLIGLAAYPLLDGIWTAFTDRAVGHPGRFVGLANFRRLFDDPVFGIACLNSLELTVGAVATKLVVGLAAAVLLTQEFPLRNLVRALAFLPWAVPGLVAALGWRWLLDEQSGAANAWLIALGLVHEPVDWLSDPSIGMFSIGMATVWQGLPFYIMMFVGAMMTIPPELHEAAAIDGAGAWGRFWNVTIPSILDVVAITVMLSTIWTFNSFNTVYILTNGGPANRTQILPTLAYQYGLQQSKLGAGASVIVSVLPIFVGIIILLTRRMLRERGVR